jgi:hypothetical protein
MLSVKEKLMEFLASKSDKVTAEDIIDFLLVNEQIDAGIAAIEKGQFKTLEQAREYYKKWLA